VAATSRLWMTWVRWWRRALHAVAGVVGGLAATAPTQAADLPPDTAEALIHSYNGGGLKATGPALLVRKSIADKVSLNASYYVDSVSNASIDVVTTASPFKEKRTEYGFGLDYARRDTLLTLGFTNSNEPDYKSTSVSVDAAQDTFGGMTTVSMGFSRGSDKVGRRYDPAFSESADNWKYRVGVTQILTPRWLLGLNAEVVADSGFLGSPYRAARVFGATVLERNPRTRTSRALKLHVAGDIGNRTAVHADYRYFWDTWNIKAHTFEVGVSRHFGESFLVDGYARVYRQGKALFYSDNAPTETLYVSRNRQLSDYGTVALGAKVAYTLKKVPGRYDVKLNGAYEFVNYKFNDFTDVRTNALYRYRANVLQVFVSTNY
jgi:hypothetical protein